MSSFIASKLSDWLDTEIRIGRTDIGLLNRVVLDDVLIRDRSQDTLLSAARLSAKLDVMSILSGRIVVNNAQLFGCSVNIYQNNPKGKTNMQFLIDALASKDTTKKELDLRINSVLVRRGEVRYNKRYVSETPGRFNPAHLHIRQLSTNIALKVFRPDSLNFQVKRLSFLEQSGFQLDNLQFKILANRHAAGISSMEVQLPKSVLSIDSLRATYPDSPENIGWDDWIKGLRASVRMEKSHVALHDLACFVPAFSGIHEPIKLQLNGDLLREHVFFEPIHLYTKNKEIDARIRLLVHHIRNKEKRGIHASSLDLTVRHELLALLPSEFKKKLANVIPLLEKADFVHFGGEAKAGSEALALNGNLTCAAGNVSIDGTFNGTRQFRGFVSSKNFDLNKLTGPDSRFGTLAFDMKLDGNIRHKIPQVIADGTIYQFDYNTYSYRNIHVDGRYGNQGFLGKVSMEDPNGILHLTGSINPYLKEPSVNVQVVLQDLSPYDLKLTPKLAGLRFTTEIDADFSGLRADDLNGNLCVRNFSVTKSNHVRSFGDLTLQWRKDDARHKDIRIQSDFLQASVSGDFTFKDLVHQLKCSLAEYLPGLLVAPAGRVNACNLTATVHLQHLDPLKYILNIPLEFKQAASVQAVYHSNHSLMQMHIHVPHLQYGAEDIQNLYVDLSGSNGFLDGGMYLSRAMGRNNVNIGIKTQVSDGILHNTFNWWMPQNKKYSGRVSLQTLFESTHPDNPHTLLLFQPGEIVVNDSLWQLHPSQVDFRSDGVYIKNFLLNQSDDRYLRINGSVSKERKDTLIAELKNINLQYVFNMINFHAVEFDGHATGRVLAHDLSLDPTVEAQLNVPDFTFNLAKMGNLQAYGKWQKSARSIFLDAAMHDAEASSTTKVKGTVTPGHDEGSGLDLHISADNTNLYFLNHYTAGIFTDLQGRTSGNLRVYGPFGGIDIAGDMMVNHADLKVDVLNTKYHMYHNPVALRPGKIIFKDAVIYDEQGGESVEGHRGVVNGELRHEHFSNMTYDISIHTDQLKAYDQQTFGDQLFCGTAVASGRVNITGEPGRLDVDIDAWPEEQTEFQYNLSRPDVLTESQFVKFVSKRDDKKNQETLLVEPDAKESAESASDVRVNFNLHITPRAKMKILMDARSGDNITIRGNGNIKASFYNKGQFQMYGPFTVQEGVYKLSLQDVIRKDFVLSPGGTIVFGGPANEATLDLQAVYSVPSVSLNDLSSGSTFSQSNVRVNCLMNIQGKAVQPHISFDFDIPNVNEDEKRMVKSLISTEEEKNMQIVYLLGIGRFYTYDYNNPNQSQSSVAMKSLLSSTLSGQLNEMLSNIIGNNNWNFGTNLSTGEQGWSDMDVEGLLSGRLLNNRLLINGNFGYRDNANTYKSSNFIGDFDIQWLLTPNGNLSLKAYSETNDRYFTKQSLTTQGIGLQFKKDFGTWKELFLPTRKKNKKKK